MATLIVGIVALVFGLAALWFLGDASAAEKLVTQLETDLAQAKAARKATEDARDDEVKRLQARLGVAEARIKELSDAIAGSHDPDLRRRVIAGLWVPVPAVPDPHS